MGLGLLGTAIAGGFKGAGEIADDELKNRAAASLAAQRDAAAAQREERLNELRKDLADKQLQAQQGQWDVQNKKTDAELQLREQANQNTSEYQKGLLKLRSQEVGKQSAQEQEFSSRSAWAKELSTTTDPAKLDSLKLYGKAQGWISDKSDNKDFTETVDPETGAKSRIYGKQPQKEAHVLGEEGRFKPPSTSDNVSEQSPGATASADKQNQQSNADIAAKQQLRSTDPHLAGMNEKEASSAAFNQRVRGLLSKVGNAITGRITTPEGAAALVDDLGKQIETMPEGVPERLGLQTRYERAISDPLYQQWLKQDKPGAQTTDHPEWGSRSDGSPKGEGFLGVVKRKDGKGFSSELSIGVNIGGKEVEIPSMVPTLTKSEVESLVNGGPMTDAIIEKAVKFAKSRMAKGLSPFYQKGEKQYPISEEDK